MLLKDLQTLATKLATGTLFHVEKAGKAYSVDYSALAKAIIEEYADSTVGGSKQSVQAAIGALNSSATPTLTPNSEIVDRQPWIHRRGNIICFGSYFHLKAESTSNTTLFTMSPQPSVACSIAAVSVSTKESYVVYVDKTGIIKNDSTMPVGYYSFVGVVAL